MVVKYKVNLAKYTFYKVGGDAKIYCKPASLIELSDFIANLPPNEPIFWLGLGSNVLIRDRGFNGAVIHTCNVLDNIDIIEKNSQGLLVEVGAGVSCAKLAKVCIKHNLAEGIWLAGIPGTIGGALSMNAGAFGFSTWQHVVSVRVINRYGKILQRQPNDYQISYRSVINLKASQPNQEWFVGARLFFKLDPNNDKSVSLKDKMNCLLQKRKATQPIGTLNCGSVFKNPQDNWAGKLIESANLKNTKIGGAAVSAKHANFIINKGDASARDIEQLIYFVQQRVLDLHKVLLEPEVRIVGNIDN